MPEKPSPLKLWYQADREHPTDAEARTTRYRELMREHGLLLSPGDSGYEEAADNLRCGYPGKSQPA